MRSFELRHAVERCRKVIWEIRTCFIFFWGLKPAYCILLLSRSLTAACLKSAEKPAATGGEMVSFETSPLGAEVCLLVRRCNKRRSAGGHSDGPGLRQTKGCWESLRRASEGRVFWSMGGPTVYLHVDAINSVNFRYTAILWSLALERHLVQFGVLMFVLWWRSLFRCCFWSLLLSGYHSMLRLWLSKPIRLWSQGETRRKCRIGHLRQPGSSVLLWHRIWGARLPGCHIDPHTRP